MDLGQETCVKCGKFIESGYRCEACEKEGKCQTCEQLTNALNKCGLELKRKDEMLAVANQPDETIYHAAVAATVTTAMMLSAKTQALEIAVAALEFYAGGKHIEDLKLDLETPSGEPPNWECDSDDKFNLENGGFAREALTRIKDLEKVDK